MLPSSEKTGNRRLPVLFLLLLAVACSNGANGKGAKPDEVQRDGGNVPPVRSLSMNEAQRLLWRSNKDVVFAPASDAERAALATLIAALWRGVDPDAPPPELATSARTAGMALELWTVEGRKSWV